MMPSIIILFMVIIAVVAVIPINLTAFTLAEYAWSFVLPKVYTWLALRWKNRFKNSFQGRESPLPVQIYLSIYLCNRACFIRQAFSCCPFCLQHIL